MKTVKLSQAPELYSAKRIKDDVIITIYDNIQEIPPESEEDALQYQADMYQLRLPWRNGIEDPSNYDVMIARVKELGDPQEVSDQRIARDIVL